MKLEMQHFRSLCLTVAGFFFCYCLSFAQQPQEINKYLTKNSCSLAGCVSLNNYYNPMLSSDVERHNYSAIINSLDEEDSLIYFKKTFSDSSKIYVLTENLAIIDSFACPNMDIITKINNKIYGWSLSGGAMLLNCYDIAANSNTQSLITNSVFGYSYPLSIDVKLTSLNTFATMLLYAKKGWQNRCDALIDLIVFDTLGNVITTKNYEFHTLDGVREEIELHSGKNSELSINNVYSLDGMLSYILNPTTLDIEDTLFYDTLICSTARIQINDSIFIGTNSADEWKNPYESTNYIDVFVFNSQTEKLCTLISLSYTLLYENKPINFGQDTIETLDYSRLGWAKWSKSCLAYENDTSIYMIFTVPFRSLDSFPNNYVINIVNFTLDGKINYEYWFNELVFNNKTIVYDVTPTTDGGIVMVVQDKTTINSENGVQTFLLKFNRNAKQTDSSGLAEVPSDNNLTIFPNPAANVLNITSQLPIDRIEITNFSGQTVYYSDEDTNSVIINTEKFAKGTYILKIYTDKQIETRKVILGM